MKDKSLGACLALSLALTILVGRDVLFAGKTFVPTEFLTAREPWGPPGATDAHLRNRLHQDIVEFNAVHAVAAARALQEEGRLLLWNSDLLCGVPILGDPQVGTFHPLRILSYAALPPFLALDLFILLHFFASGPAMFAWGRTLGASGAASLLGAAVWMLCGQQMVWFKYGAGPVAASLLPLLAASLHRGFERRAPGWVFAAGALWAALFLGSHPQLSFLALVWAALYAMARLPQVGVRWTLRAAALFGGAGLGFGAIQLLPFLESLAASQKTAYGDASAFPRPWRTPGLLLTLLWPRAFGSPLDRADVIHPWFGLSFFEFQGYMGLAPLVLAFHAGRRGRFAAAVALGTLAAATLFPAWWALKTLIPGLEFLRPHRLFLFAFAAATLAALGADRALAGGIDRRWGRLVVAGAAGTALVGLVGLARGATWISLSNSAYRALAVAAVASAAAFAAARLALRPAWKAAALLAAILADLLPGFLAYNPAFEGLPPEPPALARLPREERSIVTLESAYLRRGFRNYLALYGRPTPEGFQSLVPRTYAELAEALGGRTGEASVEFDLDAPRALRLLGVRAALTPGGEVALDALPRAWLVGRVEARPDPADRLRRLADPSFDPGRVVLLEAPLEGFEEGEPEGSVERAGRLEFRVRCLRPAVLVVSENHHRGWVCRANGREVPIRRADHSLMAVALPEGEHVVKFSFEPAAVGAGAASALAAAIFGLASLIAAIRGRRAGPRPPAPSGAGGALRA
ncbi:MAG TPA: hypothetical protein VNO22_04700 [Planctomycetota bacterium]|nr:hypothetical protein [Planctomycetota bacterium]